MTAMLEVADLRHTYGSGPTAHTAVQNLNFTVATGELACIVGPSGCGKSTLLRCIAGLIKPSAGTVALHGDLIDRTPEDLAVVFQDYSRSLFPWLSVRGNVEFPLRSRGVSRAERKKRSADALAWVGLSDAGAKYPWQLSGGMQQRVSIARALACQPSLLLMDEPFASVDAQTRFELEDLLLRVRHEHESTVLLVTHDIDESVYLGDRVLVLSKSPASIVADLRVDLPAQRDQITTRESKNFVAMRGEVARLLQHAPMLTPEPVKHRPATPAEEEAAAQRFLEAEREQARRTSEASTS